MGHRRGRLHPALKQQQFVGVLWPLAENQGIFSSWKLIVRYLVGQYQRPSSQLHIPPYRQPWNSQPSNSTPPLFAFNNTGGDGKLSGAKSWNSATNVSTWYIYSGGDMNNLCNIHSVNNTGFETSFSVSDKTCDEKDIKYSRAEAWSDTVMLGTSQVVAAVVVPSSGWRKCVSVW
jgi:hypothetical protein